MAAFYSTPGILIVMSRSPHTAAALHTMDRGLRVVVKTSSRKLVIGLCFALVIGALLVGVAYLIVERSLETNAEWALLAVNPRIWAIAIGIIGCLMVFPIGVAVRLRRADALVLSNTGLGESRRGTVLPATFVLWNEIEGITRDTATGKPGPRYVVYHLTPASAQRRGRKGPFAQRVMLRTGYELRHPQLFDLLSAAHARYARQIR